MPSALVIGLDLDIRDNPPVSELLAHERAVRTEFLAGLTGWTCDILFVTKRTITPQDNVITLRPELYYGGVEIVRYVTANDNYDLYIMSYTVDDIFRGYLKAIPNTLGKPLFMPMPNQASSWSRTRTNIINVGGGTSANARGFGSAIWFYDATSTGSTTTSYTTATVARKATQAIEAGATSFQDVASVLIANGASYNETSGYGRLPDTLTIPDPIPAYVPIQTETAPSVLPQPARPFPIDSEPEPIIPPPPAPPPAPEPEPSPIPVPPVNPTPTLFLTRSGTTNQLSTDGGGTVQVFQRRNSVDAEWTTVTETDTQPSSQTFMYRVQVSDGVTLSAYSDVVYSGSTEVSPLKIAIL